MEPTSQGLGESEPQPLLLASYGRRKKRGKSFATFFTGEGKGHRAHGLRRGFKIQVANLSLGHKCWLHMAGGKEGVNYCHLLHHRTGKGIMELWIGYDYYQE